MEVALFNGHIINKRKKGSYAGAKVYFVFLSVLFFLLLIDSVLSSVRFADVRPILCNVDNSL